MVVVWDFSLLSIVAVVAVVFPVKQYMGLVNAWTVGAIRMRLHTKNAITIEKLVPK